MSTKFNNVNLKKDKSKNQQQQQNDIFHTIVCFIHKCDIRLFHNRSLSYCQYAYSFNFATRLSALIRIKKKVA